MVVMDARGFGRRRRVRAPLGARAPGTRVRPGCRRQHGGEDRRRRRPDHGDGAVDARGGVPRTGPPGGPGRRRTGGAVSGLFRRREFLRRVEPKPRYDVVIVGGGVNGLSLAYHLAARHGIRDVAVLERTYIGSGGSGRNTQVLRANYNTPETVPLYKASLAMYRTLSQELDFNVLFSNQGELDLCHTIDSLQVEREKSLLNRAFGVQTDLVTPDEILRICPQVDLTGG